MLNPYSVIYRTNFTTCVYTPEVLYRLAGGPLREAGNRCLVARRPYEMETRKTLARLSSTRLNTLYSSFSTILTVQIQYSTPLKTGTVRDFGYSGCKELMTLQVLDDHLYCGESRST